MHWFSFALCIVFPALFSSRIFPALRTCLSALFPALCRCFLRFELITFPSTLSMVFPPLALFQNTLFGWPFIIVLPQRLNYQSGSKWIDSQSVTVLLEVKDNDWVYRVLWWWFPRLDYQIADDLPAQISVAHPVCRYQQTSLSLHHILACPVESEYKKNTKLLWIYHKNQSTKNVSSISTTHGPRSCQKSFSTTPIN